MLLPRSTFLFALATVASAPAFAQDHSGHPAPTPAPAPAHAPSAGPAHGAHDHAPPASDPHAGHDMNSGMAGHQGHGAMTGVLGPYPSTREASGTAWQPDASQGHGEGTHVTAGDWTLMGHVLLNGVYDNQGGPRGDDKAFVSGMVMGMARRPLGDGTLQLRAMLSPEPFFGRDGYPLLLASGETANGRDPLIDRQHPHDFFMELSASASLPLGPETSLFAYGGLPGEPAFGPPAFMHRASIMDSPEAPITHHWLDSTHIVFGVLTAGVTHRGFKLEASRFNGREPNQERFDIETGPLDSTAARISWNPTRTLSLQASWADLKSPEQLEPDENEIRWSASAILSDRFGQEGWWSASTAWGRREQEDGQNLDAAFVEGAAGLGLWTVFGRAEWTQNDELEIGHGHDEEIGTADAEDGGHHGGPARDVGKLSFGAIRDFRLAPNVKFGLGGLYAFNFVGRALEPSYGGDPEGAMAFVRLKIN